LSFGPFSAIFVPNRRANSAVYNKIPYVMEQGIFFGRIGNFCAGTGKSLNNRFGLRARPEPENSCGTCRSEFDPLSFCIRRIRAPAAMAHCFETQELMHLEQDQRRHGIVLPQQARAGVRVQDRQRPAYQYLRARGTPAATAPMSGTMRGSIRCGRVAMTTLPCIRPSSRWRWWPTLSRTAPGGARSCWIPSPGPALR
jgi:hypothetical protein